MKHIINKIKEKVKGFDNSNEDDEFVELTANKSDYNESLYVRPFVLEDFSDLKVILDYLREGNTIAMINIKPMRERDILELKRAVKKLKTTVEAINGDIRGFGEDHIIVVPTNIKIAKHNPHIEEPSDDVGVKPYYE